MTSNFAQSSPEGNIFLPKEVKIMKVEQVTESEKHFTLKYADGSKSNHMPGQIMEVSLFGFGEIPIGYASSPTQEETFEIVIRTVGRVSTAINNLQDGDSLFIRGPLGKGFDPEVFKGHNVLVVAGGIGLCPTKSMIQYITDKRADFKNFSLFYGAREPSQRMFHSEIDAWKSDDKVDYHEIVDKADSTWNGNVGVITELFKKTEIDPNTKVIICGPPIMFKFVIAECEKVGIKHEDIYIDVERRMKCGVGKCGHCQINDKYACLDGPVFCYADIKDLEEAL